MLRRWMDNDPQFLGSDVDVLDAIAEGRCDVGLVNLYYLGRELEEDLDFRGHRVWTARSRHAREPLSGIGVIRGSDRRAAATSLLEFLESPDQQRVFVDNNKEFAVARGVEPAPELARFGGFKRDPIDVERAGANLDDAVHLMNEVGWE